MVIDAHQHFWQYSPTRHDWISDDMAVLQKDFLPPDLQKVYEANGVEGCVAVQADQTEEETMFLLELAEQYDFIKGVVGWVDLRAGNVEERLAHFQQYKKLSGFRHIVQSEPDVDFMLRDDFQRGISLLARYGFTYDILVFPTQFDAALKLIRAFPEQKFVIDHIAKPYIKAGKIDEWASYMQRIGEHDNAWCKVSGILTEADWTNWTYEQIAPYLDVVRESFGPGRLLFGSDWPVCLLAATYAEVKDIAERFSEPFSKAEKELFFAKNTMDFYGLQQ